MGRVFSEIIVGDRVGEKTARVLVGVYLTFGISSPHLISASHKRRCKLEQGAADGMVKGEAVVPG